MRIAIIGFGEAGSAFVSGWGAGRHEVTTYDIKCEATATAGEIDGRAAPLGVRVTGLPEALAGAPLVISTVTADQAVRAAEAAAPHLAKGAIYCDLNSCAPSSKAHSAGVIEAAGAHYADVAVMAPVHPKRNMVPLLVSGPWAERAASLLAGLPMAPRVVEGPVGAASSVKMIRSVMVKGLEALTAECVLAAVAAGVEEEVLGSLLASHPGTDWPARAAYNFERAIVHGARRAAEMEEVAKTLGDLGLPAAMTTATVDWQRRLAATGLAAPDAGESAREIAGRILATLGGQG